MVSLTVYEREYATAERGGLWVSPEYAAVLEEHIHMGDETFPCAECTSHRHDSIDEDIILQWFQMRVANWPWKVECEVYHERTSRSNTLS